MLTASSSAETAGPEPGLTGASLNHPGDPSLGTIDLNCEFEVTCALPDTGGSVAKGYWVSAYHTISDPEKLAAVRGDVDGDDLGGVDPAEGDILPGDPMQFM